MTLPNVIVACPTVTVSFSYADLAAILDIPEMPQTGVFSATIDPVSYEGFWEQIAKEIVGDITQTDRIYDLGEELSDNAEEIYGLLSFKDWDWDDVPDLILDHYKANSGDISLKTLGEIVESIEVWEEKGDAVIVYFTDVYMGWDLSMAQSLSDYQEYQSMAQLESCLIDSYIESAGIPESAKTYLDEEKLARDLLMDITYGESSTGAVYTYEN